MKMNCLVRVCVAVASLAAAGTVAASPVNPAEGWLFTLEVGGGNRPAVKSKEPFFEYAPEVGGESKKSFKDLGIEVGNVAVTDAGLQMVLGYGWPGFEFTGILGVGSMEIDWEESSDGEKTKDMELEGQGGMIYGLRLNGGLVRNGPFAWDLGGLLRLQVDREVKVYETPVDGERREYMSEVDNASYSGWAVMTELGLNTTVSYAFGPLVPWATLGVRAMSAGGGATVDYKTGGEVTQAVAIRDFIFQQKRPGSLELGLDWRFNQNALLRVAADAGSPAGLWLALSLCSGTRP